MMRAMVCVLAVLVTWVSFVEVANAQSEMIDDEGLGRVPPIGNRRLTTYQSEAYRAVRSRLDSLRGNAYWRRDDQGLLRPEIPPISPIRRVLNHRNLLRSRSSLGMQYTTLLGRQDYLLDLSTGQRRGAISQWMPDEVPDRMVGVDPLAPLDDRFTNKIVDRLEQKANEYFDRGTAFFRYGDMLRARDCFEIVRDVDREKPRAYIADVFVSYRRGDYSRAVVSLLQAVKRADTMEQLRIDGFLEKFFAYGDDGDTRSAQREFQRVVESVNLYARMNSDTMGLNALFAYVSWLNGDPATAITAANLALAATTTDSGGSTLEKESGSREQLAKLVQLLSEPRSETPSPAQE